MIKLLQYLVLFILVGNGLQPYLVEAGMVVDTITEISDESDCPIEEPTEEESESTTDDLVDSDNSKLVEPKPNDFETSSGSNLDEPTDSQLVVVPIVQDWSIDSQLKYAKIERSLREHLYFSKRAIDDYIVA